jgi:endogenous inhibitor of DNA gyrase (YacG/DUF329 family)
VTGEGRIQRKVHPCPRCGTPVPIKTTGRPAKWCSQKCRRAAYEERRAAARGAIAVEVVDRVQYVEHELDQCLTEVLTSPLACRRVVYRWRQMLRDGELHKDGWRDLIMPIVGLALCDRRQVKGRRPRTPRPTTGARPTRPTRRDHLQPQRVRPRDPLDHLEGGLRPPGVGAPRPPGGSFEHSPRSCLRWSTTTRRSGSRCRSIISWSSQMPSTWPASSEGVHRLWSGAARQRGSVGGT